ncbi:MAG: TIGR03986 family CRISPR-associated RAMP protein [Cyanobacteria bacterium J06634_6]
MLPKHIEHIENENQRAFAPYNFVALPEQVVPAPTPLPRRDRYHLKQLTGKLSCTLTTESPLYIRGGFTPSDFAKHGDQPSSVDYLSNTHKVDEEARKHRAAFFAYPQSNRPTIPGSSLRGMLRSLVEIASYGKIDKVANTELIYRALGDQSSLRDTYQQQFTFNQIAQQRAGYLKKNGSQWSIQPAQSVLNAPFATTSRAPLKKIKLPAAIQYESTGDIDSYTGIPRVKRAVNNSGKKGFRVQTGPMMNKKSDYVFGPEDLQKDEIPIPFEMLKQYQDQITKGQEKLLGKHGVLRKGQGVFYLMDNEQLVFFGHAKMFRLPYPSSVKEFIPSNLKSATQKETEANSNTETIDLAEAIFGFVRDHKQKEDIQAYRGRVSITDGQCKSRSAEDIWLETNDSETLNPKILSSPKPTTFQHYLVQPEASVTGSTKEKLKNYTSQPVKATVIRGHKLYWHQGAVTAQDISANEDDVNKAKSQHTEIKPIKAGVSFDFDIHFENLTEIELGALLWVLGIAQAEDYRLSLGMGKPLGMGAVKINSTLHLDDRRNRYRQLFKNQKWAAPALGEVVDGEATNRESIETGEATFTPKTKNDYAKIFERYMTDQLACKGSFKQQERIQMLLAMLSWQEALSDEESRQRQYMALKRFKARPILPDPIDIVGFPEDGVEDSAEEDVETESSPVATIEDMARLQEQLNRLKRL